MRIYNLLKNKHLWNDEHLFSPFVNSLKFYNSDIRTSKDIPFALEKSFFMADRSLSMSDSKNNELVKEVEKAVKAIETDFSTKSCDIFIFGTSKNNTFLIDKMNGVGGYAAPEAILIYLYPNADWANHAYRATLHELNHTIRYPYGHPSTFLNWVIFEGLAELYLSEKCRYDSLSPWAISATFAEIETLLPKVKEFWTLKEIPADGHEWFFGSEEKKIPLWFGYSLGFYILSQFRKDNASLPWKDLIKLPSETIAERFLK